MMNDPSKDVYQEGEWRFDFSKASRSIKLDEENRPKPQGMRFIEFVVFLEDAIWMIEVKDPSNTKAAGRIQSPKFIQGLKTKEHDTVFVEKCRDSYTYLHLMQEEEKPIVFFVLLGVDDKQLTPSDLSSLENRIHRKPARRPMSLGSVDTSLAALSCAYRSGATDFPTSLQHEMFDLVG